MMRSLALLLLLSLPALGAVRTCPSGTLAAAQTATGAGPDTLLARAAPGLAVQATTSAGTATVQLEISCDGTNWAQVTGSSMAVTPTASLAVSLLQPTCQYRTNVTACSSCNVTVTYACSGS